jgi:DNA-binding transcriptional LysR family regulator
MNLRAFDLNVLVLLDALLDEAHVGRAATRIGLSQPAMSSALKRCRDVFDDELLVRGGDGMIRTPKAEALRGPLKSALASMSGVIAQDETPLTELSQRVSLIMADYPAVMLAGPLIARLAATAPGIDIVFRPWRAGLAAEAALRAGDADLAVTVVSNPADDLHVEDVLDERFVVAMGRGHAAATQFSLETWLAAPHVIVSGQGSIRTPLDHTLQAQGLSRRVGLVVPTFQMAMDVLPESALIALVPSLCVCADRDDLVVFAPPLPVEGFTLSLCWHKRQATDPATQHVAGLLREVMRDLRQSKA